MGITINQKPDQNIKSLAVKIGKFSRRKNVNRNIIVVRKVKLSKFVSKTSLSLVLWLLSIYVHNSFRVGMPQDLRYVLRRKI